MTAQGVAIPAVSEVVQFLLLGLRLTLTLKDMLGQPRLLFHLVEPPPTQTHTNWLSGRTGESALSSLGHAAARGRGGRLPSGRLELSTLHTHVTQLKVCAKTRSTTKVVRFK